MAMLTRPQLEAMGFLSVGANVQVSERASIYGADRISLGDNVRIDDFCVLSAGEGGIVIGSFVHVAALCSIIGSARVVLSDFSGLSSRVAIYSSSDDYSGVALTNPTVPGEFTNVRSAPVHVGRHVIVGPGSVILPGVTLEDGAAVGALSLVNKDCAEFGIYTGIPARLVKQRSRDLLQVEQQFRQSLGAAIAPGDDPQHA